MTHSTHAGLAIAVLLSVFADSQNAAAQNVRVRLLALNEPAAISLSVHERPVRLYAGDHEMPLTELLPGDQARISKAGGQLHVLVDGLELYAESLRAEPDEGGLIGITLEEGTAKQERRRYAGRLLLSGDGSEWEMRLVNEVPLEAYVASVVASEYGFDDLEGSKAMAVLVRTYALGASGKFGSEYDHVDHTLSQVYRGADSITPVSLQAARETRGEVLAYDGELIQAVYFASSGGHTADNETVWDAQPLPYLRGTPDPYGRASPHASWTSRIPRPRLLAELGAAYGRPLDGFVIEERSRDGRVASVSLIFVDGSRRTISGNDFRLIVTEHFGMHSVRSTLFDARREGDAYVFEGKGFGHGVGLSQWGAREMARNGMSYTDILDFYYTDVAIAQMDDVRPSPTAQIPYRTASADSDSDPAPEHRGSSETEARAPGMPDGESGTRMPADPGRAPSWAAPEVGSGTGADVRSETEDPSERTPRTRRRIGW